MTVKLLTEHNLEFLSLKGGCTGSSESTLVKMPHCWKSHVVALFCSTTMAPTVNNQSYDHSVHKYLPCGLISHDSCTKKLRDKFQIGGGVCHRV